ncbi:hypothetical protein PoB_000145100 [Plakobranchus ocellatus]|uniref:Uncharacterized protein n=1 Tax=Plakobranchus ocellatus TaxID=259542 RepID=A0AAV3X1P9_9GAST|nr:hypothetical protein PoB_000145100 [Plakobranchus ocellatus]
MASTKGPEPAPAPSSSSSSSLGPMLSRSRRPSAFVTDGDVQAIKRDGNHSWEVMTPLTLFITCANYLNDMGLHPK